MTADTGDFPRVLVVDDHRENLFAMKAVLATLDVAVFTASSGNEALKMLLHADFAVALLDVQMPEMDGFELAALMRDHDKTALIPIIFVTAISTEERNITAGYESGAVDYIVKPFEAETVRSKVRVFCQLYQQQRELSREISRRQATEAHNRQLISKLENALRERDKANESLSRSHENLDTLFGSMQAGIFVINNESGLITETNTAMCSLVDGEREEVLGKPAKEFLQAGVDLWSRQSMPPLSSDAVEGALKSLGQIDVPILVQSVVLLMDGVPHTVVNCVDISEFKRMEAEVFQAQKMEGLGLLAGGIAHDFNNLLVSILGNAELALLDIPEYSPAHAPLVNLQASSLRAAELTELMLAYSGKAKFHVEALDLSTVVEEMLRLLEVAIPKNVSFHYELKSGLPAVEVDVARMRQVVMNLIKNASEAIGDTAGSIVLSTSFCDASTEQESSPAGQEAPLGYICLKVKDSGCGMDEETLGKIFDPFFTTKFAGRGMGLSAIQGIIRDHGGTLGVESSVGTGSTFCVQIPASDKPAKPRITEKLELPPANEEEKPTVLVVDDEESVRKFADAALGRLGYKVLLATDGKEGVEIYRQHQSEVDCVLLDLTMPRMGGIETLDELFATSSTVKVIISSGYSDEEIGQQFGESAPAGYLQKPYSLADLKNRVADAING